MKKNQVVQDESERKQQKRHNRSTDATVLPWDVARQSKRMLTAKQVIQLYIPAATPGALAMGRFGTGPYSALPFLKINRACLYVECEVVTFVEAQAAEYRVAA